MTAVERLQREPYLGCDEHAAENLRWWQRHSGEKVINWAANAHAAVALGFFLGYEVVASWASVGSFMRTWYRSVGFTLDRGSYHEGQVHSLPPAGHLVRAPARRRPGRTVRYRPAGSGAASGAELAERAAHSRGLPEHGFASHMAGGAVAEWFDVLVHRQVVTPATPGSVRNFVGLVIAYLVTER